MKAKKCDRCGAFYETYGINIIDGFEFACTSSTGARYGRGGVKDLCAHCKNELNHWFLEPDKYSVHNDGAEAADREFVRNRAQEAYNLLMSCYETDGEFIMDKPYFVLSDVIGYLGEILDDHREEVNEDENGAETR